MKSSSLPKLQSPKRGTKSSRANKNSGINRSISPLRDQHAERPSVTPHPAYPPGESSNHTVEKQGNRYGK